ncbi:sensor histidine kinase [Roseovarius dicentrarchi]|uniref:sensor histidine kinase n=1 Tax=Roseovarius dicentrarchi TaxID=2250573 RepID=UPI000DE842B9|nr:ATP-binding protein [Roseovarius dicentrarchi]
MSLLRRDLPHSPATTLAIAALLAVLGPALAIWLATGQPQLDLPEGAVPVRLGAQDVTPADLIEEPDTLGSFAAMSAFYQRQTQLAEVLGQDSVAAVWRLPGGGTDAGELVPRLRSLGDLPFVFWFQQGVAILALLVGGWVLALRASMPGAAMFGLTSLFLPLFTLPASVYSTRFVALDGSLFRVLSGINHFGAVAFGTALVALFLLYPRPLIRGRWLWLIAALYGALYVGDQLALWPMTIVPLIVMSQMLGAIIIATLQWIRARGEPLDRAGLRWFFLTSLLGCSLFIALSVMPPTLGLSDAGLVQQGYAFGFFNLMHIGLAFAVTRWRVFDLDRYAYYVWLWLAGAALILAVDLALVGWLNRQPWASLSMSLLVAGFLYFPLRQMLLRWLFTPRRATIEGHTADLLGVALAPTNAQQDRRWDALLTAIYAPAVAIERPEPGPDAPRIAENGLALELPGAAGLAPRRLRYAAGGRRLFNRSDVATARTLIDIHGMVSHSRDSYESGVRGERERISRDVHDNIGAQLLSALHTADGRRKDDLLRDTLGDLRGIINAGFNARFDLAEIAADLRTELADRLELHDIALHWPQPGAPDLSDIQLDFRQANSLRAILREAASNTIKHSGATRLEVALSCEGGQLRLVMRDDGCGFAAPGGAGNGLANIAERARLLNGSARISTDDGGTEMALSVLLSAPEPARQGAA